MVSIVFANKKKNLKKSVQQIHKENMISTTPSLSDPIETIPFPLGKMILRVHLVLHL